MVIVLIRFPTGQNLLVLVRFGGGGTADSVGFGLLPVL